LSQDIRVPNEINECADPCWFAVLLSARTMIAATQGRKKGKKKEMLVQHFENSGIQTRDYFAGNFLLHPAYSKFGKWEDYPNANRVLSEVFFVGCAPHYDDRVFRYIEEKVKEWMLV